MNRAPNVFRHRFFNVSVAGATALLIVRWLIPAEGVDRGDQLWVAVAWSVVGGAWLIVRREDRLKPGLQPPGLQLLDLCVGLLVVGHLVGGVTVFVRGGNLRLATNLMGEWWGLACAWLVIRELAIHPAWTGSLRRALIATAATVALLGIYQHYWGLPQSVREVVPLIEQLRKEQSQGQSNTAWKLASMGVPTTEPSLTLYEKRLRDSREPFGFFALANTLGGLLGASLVWGLGRRQREPAAKAREETKMPLRARRAPLMVMIGWCLALTKSRTAWVGTVCGLIVIALHNFRRLAPDPTGRGMMMEGSRPVGSGAKRGVGRLVAMVAGIVLALAIVVCALSQSGGWDSQILREAPKSLSYRGQYWIGTLRLIAESPLLGIGLGQFRPNYLRVKLPEASEEIADPHNLFLDAWVNGGILGLAGIVGIVVLAIRAAVRRAESAVPATFTHSPNDFAAQIVFLGGVTAFAVAFGTTLALDGFWDDRYLVLGVVWCGLFWLLQPLGSRSGCSAGAAAALIALLVHLLGAGGLGMPAVLQMAFVWLAMSAPATNDRAPAGRTGMWIVGAVTIAGGLAIATLVWSPVIAAQREIATGDAAMQRGDFRSAQIAYQRAGKADPWDPVPMARSAALNSELWRRDLVAHQNEHVQKAVDDLHAAQRRDPDTVEWLKEEGELWLSLAEKSGDPSAAAEATRLLATAAERYPTNSRLLTEWSDAATKSGEKTVADAAARRALVQDDLNQRLGHVERVLPQGARERLEKRVQQ